VCNWFAPDILYRNIKGQKFEKWPISIPHLKQGWNSNSVSYGDIDNDGDLDLLVTDRDGNSRLYQNNQDSNGKLVLEDITRISGINNKYPCYSGLIADMNNDGWQDILFTNIGPNQLWVNVNGDKFELVYSDDISDDYKSSYSTGSAVADFDSDGDLDLFIANKDTACYFYINPLENSYYLRFDLEGVQSNRDAIGTKIWLYTNIDSEQPRRLLGYRESGTGAGYLSSNEQIVHFGLPYDQNTSAIILFPSGKEIRLDNILPNQIIEIIESGPVVKTVLRMRQFLRLTIQNPAFIQNLILSLLFVFMIGGYTVIAIKRYSWSNRQTGLFLIVTLTMIYIISELSRGRPFQEHLQNQLGVFILIIVIVSGFSERIRKVNIMRNRYRHDLHNFSEKIILFRNNIDLFDQIAEMIFHSMNLKYCGVQEYQNNTAIQLHSIGEMLTVNKLNSLNKNQRSLILENQVISENKIQTNFKQLWNLGIDLIIPIKKETNIYALMVLCSDKKKSAYQQEDLILFRTISNQAALAIENILYIEETRELTKQVTESNIKKRYVAELEAKNLELNELFQELKETQAQLIQSEKMSSLGQLVAGIAHELNNPIGFIYANMKELKKYIAILRRSEEDSIGVVEDIDFIKQDIEKLIVESIEGSNRVKTIVENLRSFSRLDEAAFKKTDIHEGLDSTLMLLAKETDERIKIHKNYGDLPKIICMPGPLNQVFMNFLLNAIQAI